MDVVQTRTTDTIVKTIAVGDVECAIGALASPHAIGLDEARAIIEECGPHADCIDDKARALKAVH